MRAGWVTLRQSLLIVSLLVPSGLVSLAAEKAPDAGADGVLQQIQQTQVQLCGRVVCLPEEMRRIYQTDLPTQHEHIYGLRTTNGVYYTLLRTKLSESLFADKRLREKELLLTGKVLPKSQIFDVTNMKSIRDGVVHDLYYYCDICAIKTVVPGPCMCCQAPVELVERPIDAKGQ